MDGWSANPDVGFESNERLIAVFFYRCRGTNKLQQLGRVAQKGRAQPRSVVDFSRISPTAFRITSGLTPPYALPASRSNSAIRSSSLPAAR